MAKKKRKTDPREVAKKRLAEAPRQHLELRDRGSRVFKEQRLTDKFRQFFDAKVRPLIAFKGYKLADKWELAAHAVNLLIKTGLAVRCVADSRDTADAAIRKRTEIWDTIIAADLAKACLGSESSGKVTRYEATDKLLALDSMWKLEQLENLDLQRNSIMIPPTTHALVLLHTGRYNATGNLFALGNQKKLVSWREYFERSEPDPKSDEGQAAVERGLQWVREEEDFMEELNRVNTSFAWQVFRRDENGKERVQPVNPCLRQIHIGEVFNAMRFYSFGELSGQSLPKAIRRTLRINGEPTAELDFSGMAPRMTYHYALLDIKGDVYRPKEILPKFYASDEASKTDKAIARDFVKRATNICLCVTSRQKANSALGQHLFKHPHCGILNRILDAEECRTTDLIDRIVKVHEPIQHRFFAGYGIEMMTIDGKIMKRILLGFCRAKKPVLAIHDSIVVRVSDAFAAKQTMKQAYYEMVNKLPRIKQVY